VTASESWKAERRREVINVTEMSACALGLKRGTRSFFQPLWADGVTERQLMCLWWEKTLSGKPTWRLHKIMYTKRGNTFGIYNN
jgi:hypothetical protein